MKLWILNKVEHGYDQNIGFAVIASSEAEARELAAQQRDIDGKPDDWRDATRSTCVEEALTGEARIVLANYSAG